MAGAGTPAIDPAFGVHPWYAGEDLPPDWCERLERFLIAHPGAPLGEVGLDGLRDRPSRERQVAVLTTQLELAARLGRPAVFHGARAWGDLTALLRRWAPRLPAFAVHAFAGSSETLREVLACGGRVSFAGSVCNPAAGRVRAAAAAVPPDRLLAETDTPDILPAGAAPLPGVPADRRLNQPANLVSVVAALAALRGVPATDLAARTAANAAFLHPSGPGRPSDLGR